MGPPPAELAVAEAARQGRVTVAFRFILAIPHLFILYFLQIAAGVVAFIGWWGALFTGRLPEFAVSFLSGYIRWTMRVNAYMFLLTDEYPPFTLDDDPAYPVRLAVPAGQPLNRLAVFFRWILIFPAEIVTAVLTFGAGTIVSFVAWLITLITGKLPTPLHLAFTAVLRYLTRFNCYWFMLTAAYPSGLFGDMLEASGAAAGFAGGPGYGAAPGYGASPGYGAAPGYGASPEYGAPPGYAADAGYGTPPGFPYAPGYGAAPQYPAAPGYGTPPGYDAPAGYGAPGYGAPAGASYGAPGSGYGAPGSGYGAPAGYGAPRPVFQPASWRLILTRPAKRLVVLFVVLGSIFCVSYLAGYIILVSTAINNVSNSINTTNNAIEQLNTSYSTLNANLTRWQSTVHSCDKRLTCVTRADGKAARYFSTFANELQATPMPSNSDAATSQLYSDATRAAQDFTKLSHARTVARYQNTITSTGLQQTLKSFDRDYNALARTLQDF